VQARPIAGLEGTSLPLDAFPLLLTPCEAACHIQLTVRTRRWVVTSVAAAT